jgi:hypothetical protein
MTKATLKAILIYGKQKERDPTATAQAVSLSKK